MSSDLLFAGGYDGNIGAKTKTMPTLNTWTDSVWINMPSSATDNPSWTTIYSTTWSAAGGATILRYVGPNTWNTGATGGFFSDLGDASGNWTSAGGGGFATPYVINAGEWNMVTETVQGTTYDLYVNGQLASSFQLSGTSLFCQPNADLTFDYDNWVGWGQPESLGDFNLFGQALTASEIAALYNSELTAAGNLPATPVQIAGGAVLDLNGTVTTVASLNDLNGGPGLVTSSQPGPAGLVLTPTGGSATFSGVIQDGSGQVSLTLDGPGTQVLLGNNTYSGLTTIAGGGTLQIGNGGSTGALGTGNVALNSGSLVFNVSGAAMSVGSISGTGSLTQMGPGSSLTLAGINSYVGPTTISAGTLVAGYGAPAPVMHYTFQGAGSLTYGRMVPDSTGNGWNLYPWTTAGGYVTPGPGALASALDLNGNLVVGGPSATGANVPSSRQLPQLSAATGGWTDTMWINLGSGANNPGTWTQIFGTSWGGSTSSGVAFSYVAPNTWDHLGANGGFYTFLRDAGNNDCISDWTPAESIPDLLTPGGWYMITQTVVGQTYTVYVNGQSLGTFALNGNVPIFADSTADISFGWNAGPASWGGDLTIADFNLYGTALERAAGYGALRRRHPGRQCGDGCRRGGPRPRRPQ